MAIEIPSLPFICTFKGEPEEFLSHAMIYCQANHSRNAWGIPHVYGKRVGHKYDRFRAGIAFYVEPKPVPIAESWVVVSSRPEGRSLLEIVVKTGAWAALRADVEKLLNHLAADGWIDTGELDRITEQAAGGEVTEVLGRRERDHRRRIIAGMILWRGQLIVGAVEDLTLPGKRLMAENTYQAYVKDGLAYTPEMMTALETSFDAMWGAYTKGVFSAYMEELVNRIN